MPYICISHASYMSLPFTRSTLGTVIGSLQGNNHSMEDVDNDSSLVPLLYHVIYRVLTYSS